MISDTIVAPSTPFGTGGISVVRLSGLQALTIFGSLSNTKLSPRQAMLCDLTDSRRKNLDEVIVTFFKAPNSYTGEDLIEISCHGNPFIVEKIVSACCDSGARIADPGEFTRRAFINGKLDLVQAEAVAALIHSQSKESSELNLRLLHGELSVKLNDLQKQLANALSLVEFELDISEEELQPQLKQQLTVSISEQQNKILALLSSYEQARMLTRGALVVIVGAPNVGKSTLLNTLTESDRAITSHFPGTTRDAIDVPLILDGVPINLVDTAGLRKAVEELELEGIRRTGDYMKRADLILFVHDPAMVEAPTTDFPDNIPVIDIFNKIDLLSKNEIGRLKKSYPKRLFISAKTGSGSNKLKQYIKKRLGVSEALSDNVTITTSRQQRALQLYNERLTAATNLLERGSSPYELIAIELRDALDAVGALLGRTTPDDILRNIFSHFCVGK